jgi:hypothetical protein
MLQRPPSRQKRYRERARRGVGCCICEYDLHVVEFLIATHWLDAADAGDAKAIGRAISASMQDAASRA